MVLSQSTYKEYRCSRNAPLNCDLLQQTVQQVPGAKFCLECGFPTTLSEKAEIRGTRGTYRVLKLLGTRGMGRLYQASLIGDNSPYVLKEYLLPNRAFNKEETRQRKDAFVRVAGLAPADGKNQDFRLVSSWEAVADEQGERCYLVTKGNVEASPTLSKYLAEKGAMSGLQVRSVLNQVLQTLQFLHTQKFRFPSGQVQQGIAHGNLNLESLLILESNQQFFVYVCDIWLWERLFDPPGPRLEEPPQQQDLAALGQVAFYLLAGSTSEPETGIALSPKNPEHWPPVEPKLKEFLMRLAGFEMPFETAEAARTELFKLPGEEQTVIAPGSTEPEKKQKINWKTFLLLALIILFLIAGFIFILWPQIDRLFPKPVPVDTRLPSFTDVSGVPEGKFKYAAEREGTWNYLLQGKPISDQPLRELLTSPRARVELEYMPLISPDITALSAPVDAVRLLKTDFAITSLTEGLSDELESKMVAYDGLIVYVAFSKKPQNLPGVLNGKLSIEQLRALYTGQITNWKQLGGPDLPVKIYAPTEPEAVRLFEKRVLGDNAQQIATFKSLATFLPTRETQQRILPEFDDGRAGIISFSTLVKAFDQCSGYPLALTEQDKAPVQALVQTDPRHDGEPINPNVNLCAKAYRLDIEVFSQQRYPLSFPLAVVYPKDNSQAPAGVKFAELLTTREGQGYLSKLGIVPLPLAIK